MPQIDDYVPARRYLAPFTQSFWGWDDDGQALVWADGQTIAFRAELEHVLSRLSPAGLPPMSAVVLLMAACRDTWKESSAQLGTLAGFLATVQCCDLPDWLAAVLRRLDDVCDLPSDLRSRKADLAELVFEDRRDRTSPSDAARILAMLSDNPDPGMVAPQYRRSRSFDDILRELRCLVEGLQRVDAETLRLRYRTGLDDLVEPAPLDIEPAEQVRQLVTRLQDDEELGGVARIARRLMAAMHLPQSISDREELPVGGVSDITNRGPLDRLLLSELAHDDLTLAVRVAVNEALYLRREAPPRNPPRRRAVLLDAGIRLWGVPRVFATAVGLALAATSDRRLRVGVYRARGTDVVPVDFTQREGLTTHLEVLEPDAHPGAALEAFFRAASAGEELADAVMVTSEDVAADPEFRKATAAAEVPSLLLATVARDGRFRLVSQGLRAGKAVCEARLSLDELLARPRRPAAPLVDPESPSDLPAILRVKPFPLLLSHQPLDARRAWRVPGQGAISISPQRCLMHWRAPDRGGRVLRGFAPPGTVLWAGPGETDDVSCAVVGELRNGAPQLLRIELETGECESMPLEIPQESAIGFCGLGGLVFAICRSHVEALDVRSGRKMQALSLAAGTIWQRDRFFRLSGVWHALANDGSSARLELVHDERVKGIRLISLVQCPEHDGPVGITPEGHLYLTAAGEVKQVRHGISGAVQFLEASRDGRYALVASADLSVRVLVDLSAARAQRLFRSPETPERLDEVCHSVTLHRRFYGILADPSVGLVLLRPRSDWSVLLDARDQLALVQRHRSETRGKGVQVFRGGKRLPGTTHALPMAVWGDGSRAYLDPRGMLHLKSSDARLPELALVLSLGPMAGWCSDGRIFGPDYFTDGRANASPAEMVEQVLKPFLARLR